MHNFHIKPLSGISSIMMHSIQVDTLCRTRLVKNDQRLNMSFWGKLLIYCMKTHFYAVCRSVKSYYLYSTCYCGHFDIYFVMVASLGTILLEK